MINQKFYIGLRHIKIITYIPVDFLPEFLEQLGKQPFNRFGKYTNCLSYWKISSQWHADTDVQPYIGEAGKLSQTEEYLVEFPVAANDAYDIIKFIKKIHPYKEPVIEAYQQLNMDIADFPDA